MWGNICAIGASSIYGSGDEEGLGFIQRLKIWYRHQQGAGAVFNLGIPGSNTTAQAARAAQEFAPRNPGLVILCTGINDVPKTDESAATAGRCSLTEHVAAVQQMVAAGVKNGAKVLHLVPFSTDPLRTQRPLATVRTYCDAAAQAATAAGATVIEIDDLLGRGPERLAADGMHLNAAAHAQLALKLQDSLLAL